MVHNRMLSRATGVLLLVSSLLHAQPSDTLKRAQTDSSSVAPAEIYFIKYNQDTLFGVRASIGSYSAKDRAEHLEGRLNQIKKLDRIYVDSLHIAKDYDFSVIFYREQPLFYVSLDDAAFVGKSRDSLAAEYLDTIRAAFVETLERRTATYWLVRIGFTLISLLGLIVILTVLSRAYRWGRKKLEKYEERMKGKRRSILQFLVPRHAKGVFPFLLRLLWIALIILILVFYLPFMFSFLPWTENLVAQFYGYIAKPIKDILLGLFHFLPNLFYIFVIVVITRYVIRVFGYLTREIEAERFKVKGFYKDWARPTFIIVKIILFAFALVFIFPYLPGSSSPAFKGVSIFLGVLLSLGSTSAIANIVAGIVITYMRPFNVGDRVKIGESMGDVIEKNLLVTRIRTVKNEDITIPNALIISSHLWNYSSNASSTGVILHTSVTIGYDVPSQTVTRLLLAAAKKTGNLATDVEPFVLQKSLDDYYVEHELNVFTRQPRIMARIYSELHNNILDEFNKAGVEIMSPHYSAFRDGNASTIPEAPKKQPPTDPVPPTNPVGKIIDKLTGKK